jgi:serine/threonine protein kinase/Flp pilus assembly protein TadD
MGEVYLALDAKLDRKVALKILPAELAANQDRMRRFVQEAKAAAALNHPNIAHIYEIGESEGTNFIAMEFVDGETLREKAHPGKSEQKVLLKFLHQVAQGLAKAHASGIVHRDLKPDNIMITRDGHAKILDFGLAKLIMSEPPAVAGGLNLNDNLSATADGSDKAEEATAMMPVQHSTPGVVMGTVGYMSPEQAQAKPVDQRSDIFSFGCLLYEAATGRRPFAGDSVVDTLHKIIHDPAPAITDFNPSASPELQRVIRKCLAKEPEKRYQTIRDTANDLEELIEEMKGVSDIERSVAPSTSAITSGATKSTDDDRRGESTASGIHPPASSAEYVVTGIKQHKLAVAAIALALLVGGVALIAFILRGRITNAAIQSIAVMPFVNDSGNGDLEYLSDGLTETLISSLSQLPNLNVKARSSVFRYKGKETNPQTVGKDLNVQAVLNGRVAQRGDQLTLTLELVDVQTENVIWSEQYNRKQSELVSLQSEIARDVSSKLKLKLSGADEQKLNKVYTTNPDAYQLYLKGRFYWNKLTPKDLRQSLEFYQQAIDKDPAFALAYVGISDTYMTLGIPDVMLGVIPPQESVRKARNAADKALEIDPTLAEAYASRAHVKWKERDWAGADEDFKHSIELNGNYSNAHRFYAIYLVSMGRSEEAVREVRRSEELEPLSVSVKAHVAFIFYFARRYDEAVAAGKKAVELDATSPVAHQRLGSAYEQTGMFPGAIAEFQKAVDGSNRVQLAVASLAHAFALAGKRAEAEKLLAELRERSGREYVSSYLIAEIYVALGEKVAAFNLLDKAYDQRSIDLVLAKVDPRLDPLRDDPRFQEFVKKVGIPQ